MKIIAAAQPAQTHPVIRTKTTMGAQTMRVRVKHMGRCFVFMFSRRCYSFFVIWTSLFLLASFTQADPFWKTSEKARVRIAEERAILVSVRTESLKPSGEILLFDGGGWISTPQDFAFQETMHWENLKQVSDYIKEVRMEGDRLFIRSQAFGYEARMWLKIDATPGGVIRY
jgi:hypothetical protein